jgi:arabinogalactan oligomer/maltooligosaccharide transport system substrate-binding protein
VISTGKYELVTKGKYMFRSKKRVVGAALAIALGLSGALTSAPAFAEDKVITIWADDTRGPNLVRALGGTVDQQKVGQFVPGYKVKVVTYSSFDALKAAFDATTSRTGPDIVLGANDWVSTGARNGKLAPLALSASLRSQFSATALGDLTYRGKLYGVPMDINNVAMIYNTKLVKSAPKTFGEMVNFYNANKSSKKLTSGLCVAGGGMSFGGHIVLSALGGGAYQLKNGVIDTKANPINVSALAGNINKYLVGANGKGNGFFPGTDAGCKTAYLAGKVPFAVIGNWEWTDYPAADVRTLMPVPGVNAGTYGAAFGSVSGALLTSFADTNGNGAGAKTLLTNFFASKDGQVAYQRFENRPPANSRAAVQASAAAKGFSRSAALASVPQVGAILNGVSGSASYWDSSSAFWANVLVDGKKAAAEARKLNGILKKNLSATR